MMSDLNPYEESLAVDLAKTEAAIKAMTEQLEAARHDADEAESYAWQLEQRLSKAVEALHFYSDFHQAPNDGPWGVNSYDFGTKARAVLAELEGEPLGAEFEAVWDANKEALYQS